MPADPCDTGGLSNEHGMTVLPSTSEGPNLIAADFWPQHGGSIPLQHFKALALTSGEASLYALLISPPMARFDGIYVALAGCSSCTVWAKQAEVGLINPGSADCCGIWHREVLKSMS